MLKREQPSSIEEYATALRERLAGVLPPDKVEEVVAETECHLEERADDLRRRGDVYERQAVAEFIPARKLAWGINRAWAATYLRHGGTRGLQNASAALSILVLLLMLAQFLIVSKLPLALQNPRYVLNFLFATPVIVFVLAVLACRPQLRRFTYGGLGAVAVFAGLGGWLCSTGEMGYVSRFDAPAHYKDTLALHTYQQQEARLLREGMQFYRSAYSPQYVQISQDLNLALLSKLERLRRQKVSPTIPTEQVKRLQAEITAIRLHADDRGTRYLWMHPAQEPPASLMIGKNYLVPQTRAEQQGISAFRKLSRGEQQSISTENVGMMKTSQALVAAWQKTTPDSTASLSQALVIWKREAPTQVKLLQNYARYRQKALQRDMAMMASSKWRFEAPAAREIGVFGLYAAGILIASDTLGGFLGMCLLRGLRRRKLRQGKAA